MIENLQKYRVVRGVSGGYLYEDPEGDIVKFSDVKEALRSIANNKAMFQLLDRIEQLCYGNGKHEMRIKGILEQIINYRRIL